MENKNCCTNKATYVLIETATSIKSYCCEEHLQKMLLINTGATAFKVEDCKETCCYIASDQEQTNVNHPQHYNQIDGIECIDVVKHFDFVIGNVIKYAWRAGLKNNSSKLEDLQKMLWYANYAVENESNKTG